MLRTFYRDFLRAQRFQTSIMLLFEDFLVLKLKMKVFKAKKGYRTIFG